jgi:hypothetical protein
VKLSPAFWGFDGRRMLLDPNGLRRSRASAARAARAATKSSWGTGDDRPDAVDAGGIAIKLAGSLPTAVPTSMTATGPAPTAGNDLYEAYLFGLVLRAAHLEHYGVALADADGAATVVRFRRAPGRLSSGGPPGAHFTYAVLSCPPRPSLEVHTGVGVVGKSKVVHEADVLVLPEADANRCRTLGVDPAGHDAELLIEAKYYTQPVGLGVGREFLGLCSDVSAKHKAFAATIASDSVVGLFAGRSVAHDIGVLPRRPGEVNLVALIQRVLRDYRSHR